MPSSLLQVFFVGPQWLWQQIFRVGFAGSPSCPGRSECVRIRTSVNMREESSSLVYYEICLIYPTCVLLLPDSDPAARRQWAVHRALELGSRIYLHVFRRHAHRAFTDRLIHIEHRNIKNCLISHCAMSSRNAPRTFAVPLVCVVEFNLSGDLWLELWWTGCETLTPHYYISEGLCHIFLFFFFCRLSKLTLLRNRCG